MGASRSSQNCRRFCTAQGWKAAPDEGTAASIAFPHPAEARRSRTVGAPFGLDAREVERAHDEFSPGQGAAVVANERREVLGELRQNCRQFRLEWVSAQDPAAVVERGIFDTRADESGIARSISGSR